jgi:Pumilio-family RNA binding repeat
MLHSLRCLDPFGNYLCQKLLEYSENAQRTALIARAAPAMVSIALNQHGTRALQKMVEYVSTPEQVDIIVMALKDCVVELVQDLNGNHVIQKCLNKLGPENSQFIFEAVGLHCVIVGTHRHGCCVLQRCIDHAKGQQRSKLIGSITRNSFSLVQDPFGNYVVQYILDLDEPKFTQPLCLSLAGNIPGLSKQKFSSNVIEKCLRTADVETKRMMIEEMLHANEIEKMLRDSFANYVVQTAMDYADPDTKMRMIDTIRPILPAIKQTPHGRRIANKIMGAEGQGRLSGTSSGQMTPNDQATTTSFARAKSNNNDAVGRRQFQIIGQHGIFPGSNNNTSRYMNQGFSDGLENKHAGNNSYPGMNSMNGMNGLNGLNGLNDMDGVYGDTSRAGDTTYPAYSAQPGPGYI